MKLNIPCRHLCSRSLLLAQGYPPPVSDIFPPAQEPWTLSNTLRRALEYFRVILAKCPRRVVELAPPESPLVLLVSDARADGRALPTGGYILVDTDTGRKSAFYCVFSEDILAFWGYDLDLIRAE